MSRQNIIFSVSEGVVRLMSVGPYDSDDLRAVLPSIAAATDGLDRFCLLVDDLGGHFKPPADTAGIQELSQNLHLFGDRLLCGALIVRDDFHYGVGRLVATFEQMRGGELRLFRDADQAEAWILTRAP